jgi:hypothetical protein
MRQFLHVVICEETWEVVATDSTKPVQEASRHAGISSEALSRQDAHEPCNLDAQHHGGIDNNFLVEKFPGYRPRIASRITGRP